MVGVFNFSGSYVNEDLEKAGEPANECTSLLACAAETLYVGIRTGDLGDYLGQEELPGGRSWNVRFGYDIIFSIVVGTVLFDMVTAIIIDTFGAMREKAHSRARVLAETCFLRNLQRDEFDETRSAFGARGSFEANSDDEMMFNYLLLLAHVQAQEESELTALESHVCDRLAEGSADWIPNGVCWVLQELRMQKSGS